jgi:hypothetical protein
MTTKALPEYPPMIVLIRKVMSMDTMNYLAAGLQRIRQIRQIRP